MPRHLFALALLIATTTPGQESRATISGHVTDSGGAVIARAKVVITNLDTAVDAVLETNDSGAYVALC